MLCLDDFYKDGNDPSLPIGDRNDPSLPRAQRGVDWESPTSWDADAAIMVIAELAAKGRAKVPVYDISQSCRVSDRVLTIADHPLFIAEGIFAAEIVARCAEGGLLADALAVRRPRIVNFARRLVRDLTEHRKPPSVLIRRGLVLLRNDPAILRRQAELGCRPMAARAVWRRVAELITAARRQEELKRAGG